MMGQKIAELLKEENAELGHENQVARPMIDKGTSNNSVFVA